MSLSLSLNNILANLPSPKDGILPYWLLITSAASIYNAVQNYFISWQTKEIYSRKENEELQGAALMSVTPLAARLFAAWTLIAGVVRFIAAFNLSSPAVYYIAIVTYATAVWHFTSEWLIFGSIKLNRASIGPLIVGNLSTVWMFTQMEYYLSQK